MIGSAFREYQFPPELAAAVPRMGYAVQFSKCAVLSSFKCVAKKCIFYFRHSTNYLSLNYRLAGRRECIYSLWIQLARSNSMLQLCRAARPARSVLKTFFRIQNRSLFRPSFVSFSYPWSSFFRGSFWHLPVINSITYWGESYVCFKRYYLLLHIRDATL